MSFARRHNKVNKWNIDTTNFEYMKIKDIVAADGEDVTYKVYGVTVTRKGKYGDSASVILENCFVNLPKRMLDDVEKILTSDEDMHDIISGKVGIEFYSYRGKDDSTYYSANWIDLEAE